MKSILILALMVTSVSVFAGSEPLCPSLPPGPASVASQQRQATEYVSNGIAMTNGRTAIEAVRELQNALERSKDSEFVINYITAVKKPLTLSAISVIENTEHGCKTYYATVSVSADK